MTITLAAVAAGYILDLIFGDPQRMPHPVRLMGFFISKGERFLRKVSCRSDSSQFFCGMLLTFAVVGISFIIPWAILHFIGEISRIFRFAAEAAMCYQIFAVKSLKTESMKVYYELRKNDLISARKKLSCIVGRDTENLSAGQVAKAAVETVAENTSDGIVAPLIYMLIGGAPLGFLYKAINTLDSMIGYKNDKYLYFGRFAARLDDLANYIPARIAAYVMIAAVYFVKLDMRGALRIYLRDRRNHTSPNSAHTEAVCAGALNVQLAGSNYYFGKLVEKPTIGDDIREIEAEDIVRTNKLMYAVSFLSLTIGIGVSLICEMCMKTWK